MAIANKRELEVAIQEMELKLAVQKQELYSQLRLAKEGLHPINMLNGVFKKLEISPELNTGLINTLTGLVAGWVSKKIFTGLAPGIIKKVAGELIQLMITKTAISNSEKIKAYGTAIINVLFSSLKKRSAEVNVREKQSQ